MGAKEKYVYLRNQLLLFFQNYVDCHALDECIELYNFLENHSQEDALLLALFMIERYMDEFDHDIYDHIRCMVFHDGNNAMLAHLLEAEMKLTTDAKNYCHSLIEGATAGLQKTAANGFKYDKQYLDALRGKLHHNH